MSIKRYTIGLITALMPVAAFPRYNDYQYEDTSSGWGLVVLFIMFGMAYSAIKEGFKRGKIKGIAALIVVGGLAISAFVYPIIGLILMLIFGFLLLFIIIRESFS
jgi:hypothetical protein